MKSMLSKAGYEHNPKTNVWSRPDFLGIDYDDGEDVEQRIANIVDHASDISVLSTELRQHCTDWPSLYHLSSTRANILRPFQGILEATDVLEIGAGCGAITRYLGECDGRVLALEGAPRRAGIARSRTRDLPNVMVVSDRFDDFKCDRQFDVITLIGVLEYANLFMPGEEPALEMLQRVRAMLKPNGTLIIAIENQLGLKYFTGAPEDHLGQAMYGLEGRYRKDQPHTYGRKVLTEMLRQAGFVNSEFMAHMLSHPEQMPNCLMELTRFIAMSTMQPRVVSADFEWHGNQLRKGDYVYLMLAGANRDPRAFDNPEVLDLTRATDAVLVFGTGIHHCIGHLLAKMQLSEALPALFRRFEVTVLDDRIRFAPVLSQRGPASINVRLEPRRTDRRSVA
jgi:2-polyprenyl-3-methyl-5-hydroxy-6-metoxy-1,4-benzoquinol methylase